MHACASSAAAACTRCSKVPGSHRPILERPLRPRAGTFEPPDFPEVPEPEPNNKFGSEYCLSANYTQGYGVPFGWGFADLHCNKTLAPLCKIRPAGGSPLAYYTSAATNSTFAFSTSLVSQSVAQAECNKLGGHLASFDSEAEQYEVEQVGSQRPACARRHPLPCLGTSRG